MIKSRITNTRVVVSGPPPLSIKVRTRKAYHGGLLAVVDVPIEHDNLVGWELDLHFPRQVFDLKVCCFSGKFQYLLHRGSLIEIFRNKNKQKKNTYNTCKLLALPFHCQSHAIMAPSH